MIGKLTGIIDSISERSLILDVNGVGYIVNASNRTLGRIGGKGDPASLLIETVIREDQFTLYGFADQAEKEWFTLLTSVQGVGAKAGLAILSVCPPDKLAFAIAAGDKPAITQADGVGPKLATRILTELKDKAAKMDLSPNAGGVKISMPAESDAPKGIQSDAVSALVNLGYGQSDAYMAVNKAMEQDNIETVEELIKLSLKKLTLQMSS
jgi:Holliday junction DNA helicase RuvA